jgi:uncharacterized sulfatase
MNITKIILVLTLTYICFSSCDDKNDMEVENTDEKENNDENKKVNFILIYTDDHGYSDLSCQGIKDDIRTPNIDKLAEAGVRMESGYSTAPQCVPSRAGLLAGRFQAKFGVESNGYPLDGFSEETTIAQRLQEAGYATGMAGKWHLGPSAEIVTHGFTNVFYKNSGATGYTNFNFKGEVIPWGKETSGMYHLDACTKAATTFINMHKNKPFFFYLAYRAPHVPLDATQKYLDRFPGEMPERRRKALAMMSAVDDGVGEVIKTLEENNLIENTVVFFISDNGAPLKITKEDAPGIGAGWDGSLNDPLNGEKGTLIEGGMRTPFVVYWKGKLQNGVYKHPVTSLDFAATANAMAGLPDDEMLDGVNIIPYLMGEKSGAPHEKLCWRWIAQSAIRKGKWKFLTGGGREYLFDLDKDIEEVNNVINDHPEIAAQLKDELIEWSQDLSPAGLQNGSMSKAATNYFDYYLDGLPGNSQNSANTKN